MSRALVNLLFYLRRVEATSRRYYLRVLLVNLLLDPFFCALSMSSEFSVVYVLGIFRVFTGVASNLSSVLAFRFRVLYGVYSTSSAIISNDINTTKELYEKVYIYRSYGRYKRLL